jgi:nucleotide-binding universal stress UspA family protein
MSKVIVSYDGTRNDRDALALGRLFAHAGAEISLAYVRHAAEPDPQREKAAQEEVEHLLARGADQFDEPNIERHVMINRSTADGLAALAAELDADVIAFGSSYRTAVGNVSLPHTAEELLDRASAFSIAIAPAGLRREPVEQSIGTIGVYDEDDDQAARASTTSLAHALAAVITTGESDLLVITSRSEATPGQLLLSATAREQLDDAHTPVLALARDTVLTFPRSYVTTGGPNAETAVLIANGRA